MNSESVPRNVAGKICSVNSNTSMLENKHRYVFSCLAANLFQYKCSKFPVKRPFVYLIKKIVIQKKKKNLHFFLIFQVTTLTYY